MDRVALITGGSTGIGWATALAMARQGTKVAITARRNGVFAPIEDLTPDEWDQTQSINGRGTFLTVKHAIPHLRASGGGSVVIVSSVNGTRTFRNPGFTAYACSKAAQVAFTKMAAVELAQWDIRVNVVCPGVTKTNIHESTSIRNVEGLRTPGPHLGGRGLHGDRAATSEEVAATILFLSSEEASHITGTEVYVDGGVSLS